MPHRYYHYPYRFPVGTTVVPDSPTKPPKGIPAPSGERPRPGSTDPSQGGAAGTINPWYVVLAVTGTMMVAMVLWRN